MKQLNKPCLTALLVLLSTLAFALPDDFQQKISIEADKVYLSEQDGSAIYEGNVVIKQGSIYISAARLTVNNTSDKNKSIHAEGSKEDPALFQQAIDQNGNIISGSGESIKYDLATSILSIIGSGEIKRGADVITADSIKYLMESNVLQAKQEDSSERVSITLHPKSNAQ